MKREELLEAISDWTGHKAYLLRHKRYMKDPEYRRLVDEAISREPAPPRWEDYEEVIGGRLMTVRKWKPFEKEDGDK